jgi:hypothetical protein
MAKAGEDNQLSDRLPPDWRKRIAAYRGAPAAHYQRVMQTLSNYDWMSQEERERAAFVIVEKEQLRDQGQDIDDED